MERIETPWGLYEILNEGKEYKIKKIVVFPRQSLSLQLHLYRTETWTVLNGMARVTQGGWTRFLSEGKSISIQRGEKHRLENFQDIRLEVLEVQFGSYLGEDDVIRFEDEYGRV